MAALSAYSNYDTSIDTSGWISGNNLTTTTGTLGTSGIIWAGDTFDTGTASSSITATTSGFGTGSFSSGSVTLSGSSGLVVYGDVHAVSGDTVHVTYQSDGSGNISNPYIHVDSAENKEARVKQQLKQLMKSNLLIKIGSIRQNTLRAIVTPQEMKARESLRDLITEREWRRYMTNGFVIIPAVSGKCYQVFNDQRHIKVYVKGKLTDEICIHTDASECPPTDHILNMMCLINNDEQLIWSKGVGNVYNKDGSRNRATGNGLVAGNGVVGGVQGYGATITAAGEMSAFIDSGRDVEVEYIGHLNSQTKRQLSLVETFKKLKAA